MRHFHGFIIITKVTRLQDDELAIVVANEPVALAIHCGDTDDDDEEVIPIEVSVLHLPTLLLLYSVNLIQVYTLDLHVFFFFFPQFPLWTGNSGEFISNNHDIIVPLDIALSLLRKE